MKVHKIIKSTLIIKKNKRSKEYVGMLNGNGNNISTLKYD